MSEKFRSKKMLSLGLGHKVMKNLGSNQTTLSSVKLWSRSGLANPGLLTTALGGSQAKSEYI